MASGFPPIAATDKELHSLPSHHILAMASCDILSVVSVPYQYHWTTCPRSDVCISSPL